jgi:hypothetical protein
MLLLVGRDVEQARPGPERARWACGHVFVAERPRPFARDQPVGHDPGHRDQRRLQHRHVDELALAGPLAAEQRGCNRKGRRDSAHGVGHGITDTQRRGPLVSGDAHHARQALHDLVIGRICAKWAVLAEA